MKRNVTYKPFSSVHHLQAHGASATRRLTHHRGGNETCDSMETNHCDLGNEPL